MGLASVRRALTVGVVVVVALLSLLAMHAAAAPAAPGGSSGPPVHAPANAPADATAVHAAPGPVGDLDAGSSASPAAAQPAGPAPVPAGEHGSGGLHVVLGCLALLAAAVAVRVHRAGGWLPGAAGRPARVRPTPSAHALAGALRWRTDPVRQAVLLT